MQGIKNLVFDFGGVLVGLDRRRCAAALREIGAGGVAGYVDEYRQEDLFHELEVGNIGTEGFCDEVRRVCPGCQATNEAICEAWNALLTGIPHHRLDLLSKLKGRYRLMLLSNTNPIHWQKSVDDFFNYDGRGVADYFERVFLSYRMHLVKPDERIFRQMLLEADIKPSETLFIDDSPVNCAAASELGINALLAAEGEEWEGSLCEQ